MVKVKPMRLNQYFKLHPYAKNSFLISFEGIEGSGKSTQIPLFIKKLEQSDYQVHCFREPGATKIGEQIRSVILNQQQTISPLTQTLLFLAARTELLNQKVLPCLKVENTIVILDRYIDSTLAYQGKAGKMGFETICRLHQQAPLNTLPHLTFYLRIDYQTSVQRQKKRGAKADYFESQKQDFYSAIINGYEELTQHFPTRIKAVDATADAQFVCEEILNQWEQFRAQSQG